MLAVSWLVAVWTALVATAGVGRPLPGKSSRAVAEELVARLEDIEHEYPEGMESVTPADRERANHMVQAALELAAGDEATRTFLPGLYEIRKAVRTEAQSFVVQSLCTRVIAEIFRSAELVEKPPTRVDLERGRRAYRRACMTCHGRAGQSQAGWLDPLPPDLAASDTLNRLRPARVFNTVTFGIHGTPMPAFRGLSEDDRWAIAFYVFTLRPGQCTEPHPKPSLAELARYSDSALVAAYGENALACLRRCIPGSTAPPNKNGLVKQPDCVSADRSR